MYIVRNLLGLLNIILLASCSSDFSLTEELNKDYYDEIIQGFYINKEDAVIFIAGEKYSYVVQCDLDLCQYVGASRDLDMEVYFSNLVLTPDGLIHGNIDFWAKGTPWETIDHIPLYDALFGEKVNTDDPIINTQLRQKYLDIGLLKKENNAYIKTDKKLTFEAKRYVVEGVLPFVELDTPLDARIKVIDSNVVAVSKMIVTPVAFVVDGVVIATVLPFSAAYFAVYMAAFMSEY